MLNKKLTEDEKGIIETRIIEEVNKIDRKSFIVKPKIEIIKKVDSQITLTGARYYTEAADLQEAGINTIVFGAGSIVQAHQVDEYVEVKELEYVEKVYTEIFKRLR